MNAKNTLKKLNYLPRWAWYLIGFFTLGPFGLLAVYLIFHVLGKIEKEQAGEEAPDNKKCSKKQESAAGAKEYSEIDEVIRAGRRALLSIRKANDIIADEALSAQIDSIEDSCSQLLSILEQRPQLLSQLRTFLRYYLPTTLRLLDARAKLENNASTPKAREVRARISEAIGAIDKAFKKQVEALDAYLFIDLESEMDVLRDMLKADGLIDESEPIDDPFKALTLRR